MSHFFGHSKSTAWSVFTEHHDLLDILGKGEITDDVIKSSKVFICKAYGVPDVDSCNEAQVKLFCMGRSQETLPLISDAA